MASETDVCQLPTSRPPRRSTVTVVPLHSPASFDVVPGQEDFGLGSWEPHNGDLGLRWSAMEFNHSGPVLDMKIISICDAKEWL